MRPIRLEVEGFAPFRESVAIDFDDAPYFALVGPTGSGKSSIIDAMTFALYGSIPRLDMKSVLPVISQGQIEARIRFDFAIAAQTYTAVRVVRKMGADRATTKEARLEQGEELLAGDPDGVTAAVARLLGLGYEHFTKCVVLPQGAFARFMHDKPADRGDLLVKLLDLGVYEQMQQAANARASATSVEAEIIERRLAEELSFATPEARDQTIEQVRALEALLARIDSEQAQLEQLREAVRATREAETKSLARIEALAAMRIPPDVSELSTELGTAQAALTAADTALADAEQTLREAEKAFGELPPRGALDEARAAHRQRATCAADLAAAGGETAKRSVTEQDATKALQAELENVAQAEREHDRVRLENRAHELVLELRAGEACPVCGRTVHQTPRAATPADLDDAARSVALARERHATSSAALAGAQRAHAAAEATAKQLAQQLAALDVAVGAHPDLDALDVLIEGIETAQAGVEGARKAEAEARKTSIAAQKTVEAMRTRIESSWRQLDTARDRVADLAPPPIAREDLARDWAGLASWALEQAEDQQRAIGEAARARVEAESEGIEIVERQRSACRELGIDQAEHPRDACIAALERARGSLERIEVALETAAEQLAELVRLTERAAVSKTLAQHLKANAFEAWILDEALRVLQEGATEILAELSGGQYSLTLDKNRNFAVIDHRNADEVRSAKTLSGGETFLASLALALALADRIAQLSANSAVRLESIFLDEGFGTLDAETLDVVEAAIANLAASGRVVGIVTHVRDLAERVPVRYEVRRGPTTSTVEKVLA